ncbi:MAG: sarcosine oxidase subunit beta family protein [Pseudomonadota bacterium]
MAGPARYSALRLVREGFNAQKGWTQAWRQAEPKASYDVVIIGAGGHGLATAYYLAKQHGVTDVAVIDKGWLGGGNTGRNTTIVRSNYFYPESAKLYDLSLRLYEELGEELNYNLMLSQRGMMILAHSQNELEVMTRSANAMLLNGVDAELLTPEEVQARIPLLDMQRWPVWGALNQPRGGVARHDAVAWGYARGADALGVDIIQNCAVTGFLKAGERIVGVETSKGPIGAGRVAMAAAGHSGVLAGLAGFRLPLVSYCLQGLVSEPIKPVLDTVVMAPAVGTYVSQSDKGELVFGAGIDRQPSYAQRGNFPTSQGIIAGLLAMFPSFSQLKLLRQWGGIVDVSPDSSPLLGPTPVEGLYMNCGWGTGGFKAIPAGGYLLAHILATGEHHPISKPFDLERFTTGALIDEAAAAGIAH